MKYNPCCWLPNSLRIYAIKVGASLDIAFIFTAPRKTRLDTAGNKNSLHAEITYDIEKDYHQRIKINHQPDATIFKFIIPTHVYSSTCFGRSSSHHQELNDCSSSLWFYLRIVVIAVLCSWSGRPVKPEAPTAVIELLMMGGRTPETC